MGMLDDLFAKMKGEDTEEEAKNKKNAQQGIAENEARTGTKYTEEPGIEPDEVTEGLITAPITGGATVPGMARSVGGMAVRQAEKSAAKSVLDKVKEGGMPKSQPTFSEGVAAGTASPGGNNFAKFIRQAEETEVPAGTATATKQTVVTPRFGTTPEVKALQSERQFLDLKTPQGRARLQEIDGLLKNRTYTDGK